MFKSNLKTKIVRTAAGIAMASMAVGGSVIGHAAPAGADPKQFSSLVGVGSDTIQDVMDGLAGNANGINYTPIQSDTASGNVQVTSWDAIPAGSCITPKAPGATFDRPNGSGAGITALSRAIDGVNLPGSGNCGPASGKVVSGLVDFARSSKGPATSGSALYYVPLGRDGVSFGYYPNSGVAPASVVTSLTRAQLTSIFTTGPTTIGGVSIVPCGIQTSSGTYSFWNTVTTATAAQENTATTTCQNAGTGSVLGRVEENDGNKLKAKGDALPTTGGGTEVIVGFSAAQFIAQSNGKSVSHLPSPLGTVDLGSVTDNGSGVNLGKPYTGSAPTLTPVSTFYGDAVFGRNVYVVLDKGRVDGFGDNALKTMFVQFPQVAPNPTPPAPTICQSAAQATVNLFGFLSTPANATGTTGCGTLGITGPLT